MPTDIAKYKEMYCYMHGILETCLDRGSIREEEERISYFEGFLKGKGIDIAKEMEGKDCCQITENWTEEYWEGLGEEIEKLLYE